MIESLRRRIEADDIAKSHVCFGRSMRRKLLLALGAGAFGMPLAAFSQQQNKVWRVGFLAGRHVDRLDSDVVYGPFRQGMRELGYIEGKNLVIEWRSAESKNERLPGLAADLVNLKVDVIVAADTSATSAAQKVTTTIPIVMGNVSDPIGRGFIKSLARPAGNITGLTNMAGDVSLKRLEMLMAMVPKLSRLAVLINLSNVTNIKALERLQSEGQKRGLKVLRAEARTPQEIETAFALMVRENAGALLVWNEPLFAQQKSQIAELTAKHRLPAIAVDRMSSEAGILMSYGVNSADNFRRAATYVDKIFKGAKPGDLPVEQPTIFELVINGKTAKALGLTIPQSLLISADKVIE
jgi:putative ABC transport system substrate-binding protein